LLPIWYARLGSYGNWRRQYISAADYDGVMTPDGGVIGQDGGRGFVVSSEVTISPESAETLEHSFRERLRLVEKAPGFQRLETWRDRPRGTKVRRYVLFSDS
jgi:hypothetical protein